MTWTLPNILTALRLLAAPLIAVMFLTFPRPFADFAAMGLFIVASLTDYLDGYLARRWKQVTKLGAMLDPIADKAMVVIALMIIVAFSSLSFVLVLPAALILFREVFVSGLREFLGDTAGTLKVTKLAKWKTATQMVAIAVLFAQGIFEHYFGVWSIGMGYELLTEVLNGTVEDELGVLPIYYGYSLTTDGGLVLIWLAAVLTLMTGFDYFRKAMPHLKD